MSDKMGNYMEKEKWATNYEKLNGKIENLSFLNKCMTLFKTLLKWLQGKNKLTENE